MGSVVLFTQMNDFSLELCLFFSLIITDFGQVKSKCRYCHSSSLSISVCLCGFSSSSSSLYVCVAINGGLGGQFGSAPSLTACDCCVHSWCNASLAEYFSLYTSAAAFLSVALRVLFHPRSLFNI